MGLVRDVLSKSVDFVREEIMPLRHDLIKAGIITPENSAYDPKASLVDPLSYGQSAFGYKEKYSLLDYAKCRQITYADPIVAAVIQTRLNQVASFTQLQADKYKVGYKVKMRDSKKPPGPAEEKRIQEIETFIQNCGVPENFEDTPDLKRRDSFETFIRKIARDSLTFDQVNFEVIPRVDGRPYCFQAVDAATIKVIPDKKEMIEQYGGANTKYNMTNVLSYGSEKEFKPKSPKFAQVLNGSVRHVFDEWEMAFGIRNPRTDIYSHGYGYSEIEMLVATITSHMNAETYNRKFFSQGAAIKGMITFEGSVPPDQLEAFRRQWYQQVTGVNNAWRTPIMALGKDNKLNWTSLHSNNREMEFGKWMDYCIKTICGVFQIDPIEIGFDISKQGSGQNSGGGGLGQGNQAERVSFSQDKGLRPLLVFIQSLLNDYVVYRLDPNYEFEFVGLNVNSEKDDLDRSVQQAKTFKTINEVRAENDLDPLPSADKIKGPGDLILDASLIQFITSQQAAAQAAANPQGQPGMPGAPGQPGAEDGQPGADQEDPGADQGDNQEEEPDYENMTPAQLHKELDKINKQSQQPDDEETLKSFFEELDL